MKYFFPTLLCGFQLIKFEYKLYEICRPRQNIAVSVPTATHLNNKYMQNKMESVIVNVSDAALANSKIIRNNAIDTMNIIKTFVNGPEFGSADHIDIEIRLELLERKYTKSVYHNDIHIMTYKGDNREVEIQQTYIDLKTKLKKRLVFLCDVESSQEVVSSNTSQDTKTNTDTQNKNVLRHIPLLTFGGDKKEYKVFVDAFMARIATNKDLTDKQKMEYLKLSLTGAALALLTEKSTEDYVAGLELLENKYSQLDEQEVTTELHDSIVQDYSQLDEQELTKELHDSIVQDYSQLDEQELTKELHDSIVQGRYVHAVEVSKYIIANYHSSNNIVGTGEQLAAEKNKNLLSYLYQLWLAGETGTVTDVSSICESIFNEDEVVLKHVKYGQALKLAAYTDRDGDREAWGDATDDSSERIIWQFVPYWQGNNLCFKLKNLDCGMYLKLVIGPDRVGDRKAYGSSTVNDDRELWYLKPMLVNHDIGFFIVNMQYDQGLKLAEEADSSGDRLLWGHKGDIYHDAERFGWIITKR